MSWIERWRGLTWDPPGDAGWLFILLALGTVAYAVVLYRRTDAPLGRGLRVFLATLRALALLVMVAILCRPVLSLAVPGGAERGVLVLLDRTESISLPGRAPDETRDQELARAADGIRLALADRYPVTFRSFDGGVGPVLEDGVIPAPEGDSTDPATALEQGLAQGVDEGRPGAMILVSDGTQTEGADPVPVARRLGVPVETVALGSPSPVADLAITRVRANREAFVGERAPLEAVLRMQGLEGTSVRVRLLDVTDGEAPLADATAALDPTGAELRVNLSFVPSKPGLRFLEVRVPPLPGEATTANNRRLVAVEVREEKTALLMLSGRLTWDHTFLRRALDADSTLDVVSGYWRRGGFRALPGGADPPPLTASGLRKYRAVVLDHVSAGQLGPDGTRTLAGYVQGGGGLLLLTGSGAGSLGDWRGSDLEPLLPVMLTGGGPTRALQLRVTPAGRRHVLFDPSVPGAPPLEAWTDLPPVVLAGGLGSVRGAAEALMAAPPEADNAPALSWTRAGRGRVILVATGGIWKWEFADARFGPAENMMPGWWRRAAHWLVRPDLEARLDIHPEESVVARGRRVAFAARVTDEAYQPIADAEVEVAVTPAVSSQAEPRRLSLAGGNGFFSGVLEGLPPGRYRYVGNARSGDEALGTVEGVFAVDSLGAEMERLEADHELLERVATAGGGRLWHPDSLDALGDELQTKAQSEEERVQMAIWDHPLLFVLFVLLVSVEWLLRRRRGLI